MQSLMEMALVRLVALHTPRSLMTKAGLTAFLSRQERRTFSRSLP